MLVTSIMNVLVVSTACKALIFHYYTPFNFYPDCSCIILPWQLAHYFECTSNDLDYMVPLWSCVPKHGQNDIQVLWNALMPRDVVAVARYMSSTTPQQHEVNAAMEGRLGFNKATQGHCLWFQIKSYKSWCNWCFSLFLDLPGYKGNVLYYANAYKYWCCSMSTIVSFQSITNIPMTDEHRQEHHRLISRTADMLVLLNEFLLMACDNGRLRSIFINNHDYNI
jgi:hypothetical protein